MIRISVSRLFMVWSGLMAGNFFYEALTDRNNWARAVELSYFNAWTLLTLWIVLRING